MAIFRLNWDRDNYDLPNLRIEKGPAPQGDEGWKRCKEYAAQMIEQNKTTGTSKWIPDETPAYEDNPEPRERPSSNFNEELKAQNKEQEEKLEQVAKLIEELGPNTKLAKAIKEKVFGNGASEANDSQE